MAKNERLSTQDIATVLIEELSKIEGYTTQLRTIEVKLREDIASVQSLNARHISNLDTITKRRLSVDTSKLEQTLQDKQILPRSAVWALIVQPLIIALIAAFLVWLYIDSVELAAQNEGYRYALESTKPTTDESAK